MIKRMNICRHHRVAFLAVALLVARAATLCSQTLTPTRTGFIAGFCDEYTWAAFYPDSTTLLLIGCAGEQEEGLFHFMPQRGMAWKAEMDSVYDPGTVRKTRLFNRTGMFNSDSSRFVTHGAFTVLWDLNTDTNQLEVYYLDHEPPVYPSYTDAVITAGDREIVRLEDSLIAVYDYADGSFIRSVQRDGDYRYTCMAVSPDRRWLVAPTTNDSVHVYDFATLERVAKVGNPYPAYYVQFSPDGSRFITTSLYHFFEPEVEWSFRTTAWEVGTWRAGEVYHASSKEEGEDWRPYSVRYNRNGTMITAACSDYKVRIFSTITQEELAEISYPGRVRWSEFSAGGTQIVIAGAGPLEVWSLYPASSVTGDLADHTGLHLFEVVPNPASGPVDVTVEVREPTTLDIELYDASGIPVWRSEEETFVQGRHRWRIPAGELSSGVYLVALRDSDGRIVENRRIMIVR